MARKKDLKNHRKRIPENNHAIVNEEISSEENLENQDLSMKTKMDSGDVYGRGDVIVYNDQPRRREDLKNQRKMISENKHDIDEEISSAENLENDRGDILLYDGGLQRREQDQSDDVKLGLELTPDEQSERVNLFLLGFASIIFMNAMAVLIILFVENSKYEDQLVIKSSIIKRQTKGRSLMTPIIVIRLGK